MGAPSNMEKLDQGYYVTLNDTLTSGITKSDPSKPISEIKSMHVEFGLVKLYLKVNSLLAATASSASLAFGEHVFSYPSGMGIVEPLHTSVLMTSVTAADQAATAGEVGMGTVIASGSVSTLGGTATFEDIMEGSTLANHVAATTLTTEELNRPIAFGDHGAGGAAGFHDCSAAAVKAHLNIASAWDNAVTTDLTFSADIVHWFRVHGSNFGVE